MVEKMTAAPLPLVESSDNYLSTSSEENSAEEVEDEFAEVALLHIDLSLISLAQTVPCLPPVRNLIQRTG